MSQHDDGVRLHHMLDAARQAVEFTRGRTSADLCRDAQLALALTRLVEIIGEAAKNCGADSAAEAHERAARGLVDSGTDRNGGPGETVEVLKRFPQGVARHVNRGGGNVCRATGN